MASVMVIPTEYDSHRPRRESQSRKAWVPPPESVRIRVCRPPPQAFGQLGQGELGGFEVVGGGVCRKDVARGAIGR